MRWCSSATPRKARGHPDIVYYEADRNGNLVHETWFQAPYSSMLHDFAVTQNFVIFPIIGLVADADRLRAGQPLFAWDPARTSTSACRRERAGRRTGAPRAPERVATRTTTTHYVGDASTTAHDEAGPGEGYVMAVVGRHDENRGDLLILDAKRIDAPPVAIVKLPIRIPYGLHGNWVSATELRKGSS